jgi:membrane protease YdiL (CAAX protease family)
VEFLAAAAASPATPQVEQLDFADYAWVAFAAVVLGYLCRRVFRAGGDAVEVSGYGSVELGLALSLAFFYVSLGCLQFMAPPAETKTELTLSALLLFATMTVVFTAVVILVLKSRGRSLTLLFGLDRQPIWKACAIALVLTFAAFPVILVGSLLTQGFSTGPDDLQEIVKFFRGAGQGREKIAVALSAVIIAPVSEELFFRGLIYGVAKKYGGLAAAIIFNATLFAFIHGSLPAFGGLFALAACLTLAYEFSGTLYVPIVMHACFNATQLVQMLLDPAAPKP